MRSKQSHSSTTVTLKTPNLNLIANLFHSTKKKRKKYMIRGRRGWKR